MGICTYNHQLSEPKTGAYYSLSDCITGRPLHDAHRQALQRRERDPSGRLLLPCSVKEAEELKFTPSRHSGSDPSRPCRPLLGFSESGPLQEPIDLGSRYGANRDIAAG